MKIKIPGEKIKLTDKQWIDYMRGIEDTLQFILLKELNINKIQRLYQVIIELKSDNFKNNIINGLSKK